MHGSDKALALQGRQQQAASKIPEAAPKSGGAKGSKGPLPKPVIESRSAASGALKEAAPLNLPASADDVGVSGIAARCAPHNSIFSLMQFASISLCADSCRRPALMQCFATLQARAAAREQQSRWACATTFRYRQSALLVCFQDGCAAFAPWASCWPPPMPA